MFGQFANVVEWEEWNDEMIFWKWKNDEIKKGSKLILRAGQDAIFINNGRIEGIFTEDGDYDIASDIIPFLSTLKGFKFGFNSGMRVEVLFVNTKEFLVKWGTKAPILIPTQQLPGGLPIRANGSFTFKINDYVTLIDKLVGVRKQYLVSDIRERITSILDQLLMKWISKEGKDMFNLQANAMDIARGIKDDLDMQIYNDGFTVTGFNIMSFNYPKEVQDMINKSASHSMIGNMNTYNQVAMADGMSKGTNPAGDMAAMMMGMNMANNMVNNMNQTTTPHPPQQNQQTQSSDSDSSSKRPKFCPECGEKTNGAKFCPECGNKL